jgi:hypothetical protein
MEFAGFVLMLALPAFIVLAMFADGADSEPRNSHVSLRDLARKGGK